MANFWVADLSATGEIRLKEAYEYALLEKLPGAIELMSFFSTHLWRSPDEFDLRLPGSRLRVRWRACSDTSGLVTLRDGERLSCFTVLICGQDDAALKPLQSHLVRELHDTGYEPAFDLLNLHERPLSASINFQLPEDPADRQTFAQCDRCFAASYFRKMGLA